MKNGVPSRELKWFSMGMILLVCEKWTNSCACGKKNFQSFWFYLYLFRAW